MIQALLPMIGDIAGGWIKGKAEEKAAASRAKVAKAEAEAEVMKVAATHEASWEKGSNESWKDEAWTVCFIVIISMCFIPHTQPYVARGFEVLSTTPDWFQWAVYASIAASFGLRGMKGLKK
jgi:hypothetical protein